MDVTIVGAGVLGVSLAYHLSQQGLKVCVIERESTVGAHASGKNAGMFRQLYKHPQLSEWALRSKKLWPTEIREKCFQETGSLIFGRVVAEHHRELFEQRDLEGIPAVYTQGDGLIDSGTYVQLLAQYAKTYNVEFLLRTAVKSVSQQNGSWQLECSGNVNIRSAVLVNAAGAWINRILEPLCPVLQKNAEAYARHLFVVCGWQKNYMPSPNCGYFWDERTAWYMRRWDTQSRLVSICDYEKAHPDTFVPSSSTHLELAEKLQKAVPEQYPNLNIARAWHCFRTYTEDKIPIWGEDPDAAGLFWLAAFGGFGMSTSFAAAYDAAQYIFSGKSSVTTDFYPGRAKGKYNSEILADKPKFAVGP